MQVLELAEKAGLVKLGHVALDGTKIKANASKHKAMSYARMKKREAELKAEVDRWLKAAEAADAEEDKLHGSKRGDEMPDWVADKQKRLEKIRAAKAELEAEAKAAAEEEMRRREKAEEQRKAQGRKKNGKTPAPPKKEPDGKTQRNFTDPESRILKTKDGYIQGYNAQAAVDAEAQIIVAHGLTQSMSDQDQLVPLIDGIKDNLGRKPKEASADAGYCSEANLAALAERDVSAYVATGRAKHPAERQTKYHGAADKGHAGQAEAGGMAKSIPVQKANRGAGVRTDQTGKRVQAVPVAWHRESEGRMGVDLHRPQPHQARPHRLSELSFLNSPIPELSGQAPHIRRLMSASPPRAAEKRTCREVQSRANNRCRFGMRSCPLSRPAFPAAAIATELFVMPPACRGTRLISSSSRICLKVPSAPRDRCGRAALCGAGLAGAAAGPLRAAGRRSALCSAVEPNILETPAVIDAVDVNRHPLDIRLPASGGLVVSDDWAGDVLLQLAIDLPHHL